MNKALKYNKEKFTDDIMLWKNRLEEVIIDVLNNGFIWNSDNTVIFSDETRDNSHFVITGIKVFNENILEFVTKDRTLFIESFSLNDLLNLASFIAYDILSLGNTNVIGQDLVHKTYPSFCMSSINSANNIVKIVHEVYSDIIPVCINLIGNVVGEGSVCVYGNDVTVSKDTAINDKNDSLVMNLEMYLRSIEIGVIESICEDLLNGAYMVVEVEDE